MPQHCVSRREVERVVGSRRSEKSQHKTHQLVEVVGAVGIEPTTFGLKGRCSTTELRPCAGG